MPSEKKVIRMNPLLKEVTNSRTRKRALSLGEHLKEEPTEIRRRKSSIVISGKSFISLILTCLNEATASGHETVHFQILGGLLKLLKLN